MDGSPPSRILCPWNFPGKNTGAGCHFLLQGIFPTHGSNLCFLHLLYWQEISLPPVPPGTLWLLIISKLISRASLVAQMVKRLPTMWETWLWSLGREDPLEKKMPTLSSILAWKIPWMEEPGKLQSVGSQKVRHNWVTNTFSSCHLLPPRSLISIY